MNTNRILILKINSFKKSEGAIKNGLSRDTGNTGNTRHKTETNKAQIHNTTHKNKRMSNTDPTLSRF